MRRVLVKPSFGSSSSNFIFAPSLRTMEDPSFGLADLMQQASRPAEPPSCLNCLPRYAGFRWEGAIASHWQWPVFGVVAYLLTTGALCWIMRSRAGFQLRWITAVHNLILSMGSAAMLIGTIVELWRRYVQTDNNIMWFFCEDATGLAEGPLYFWSYIYYLSKYYEMLDTVLVVLQKSKVPNFGLQVYHHAAVVPMAWFWCQYQQSLQWGGLVFNTMVHVIMYQYYAWRVIGLPTPWKKWITKLQIIQFITSFVLLAVTLSLLWKGHTCAGPRSLLYNCLFNATLLLQFVGIDHRNNAKKKEN